MANKVATLHIPGQEPIELPILSGTEGPEVIDVRALGAHGYFTYDPGFLSTASCTSKLTYIDGDAGILLYRGYPIAELAKGSNYLEVCYLLLNGELPNKEQFTLGDDNSLDSVVQEICDIGYIPSFCTACYRAGRTGENFMGFAKSKFVHNFCIPNAIFTFREYLLDYASPETREKGEKILNSHIEQFKGEQIYGVIQNNLRRLENGERDVRI